MGDPIIRSRATHPGFPGRAAVALLALVTAAPCLAVGFEDVPATFLGAPVSLRAMSGNGLVMAGHTTAAPFDGMRWTPAAGWQSLGAPPLNAYGIPAAVSYDGSAIAVKGNVQRGYRWKLGTGWQEVFITEGPRVISADGKVVVGDAHAWIFNPDDVSFLAVWREGVGTIRTTIASGHVAVYVRAVKANGLEVIALNAAAIVSVSHPLRIPIPWTTTPPPTIPVPVTPAGFDDCTFSCQGEALAISADGGTLVGSLWMWSYDPAARAARWDAYGAPEFLEPSLVPSVARDVSGNGDIVVGQRDGRAFVWTPGYGMQDLQSVLEAGGIDLTGWTLGNALAISDDGTIIAGTGTRPGGASAIWRVTAFELPPQVPALGAWGALALAIAVIGTAAMGSQRAAVSAVRPRSSQPAASAGRTSDTRRR